VQSCRGQRHQTSEQTGHRHVSQHLKPWLAVGPVRFGLAGFESVAEIFAAASVAAAADAAAAAVAAAAELAAVAVAAAGAAAEPDPVAAAPEGCCLAAELPDRSAVPQASSSSWTVC